MKDLINTWKKGKEVLVDTGMSTEQLISKAREKKRAVLYAHYGNILILTLSLVGICFFFYFKISITQLMSKIGMYLMTGGLFLRIVIEIGSVIKSRKIQLTGNMAVTTQAALSFYKFRKTIHGPVTLSIMIGYILGFYLLSPEFSQQIQLAWMVLMHISFIVGAYLLIRVVKKGIQEEMIHLLHLTELKKEITRTENDA